MQSWKKLEVFIADYLGWKRITKKHYGDSCPDLKGDGYTSDSKHYKKHKIHSIKREADRLYKDDIIIFTKEKGTHYDPSNILVTVSLGIFDALLKCKRIAEKIDKRTNVPNLENDELINNLSRLKFRLNICKDTLRAMGNIIKEMEEK